MENFQRDKFLTEVMGECYHEICRETTTRQNSDGYYCKCGIRFDFLDNGVIDYPTNCDFSTWEGFGKLWNWANRQDWFEHMMEKNARSRLAFFDIIDPDKFADVVYEYLRGLK